MAHTHTKNQTRLGIAAALTGLFMLAEVAGGIVSGSLALLADAGHMLTDFAALSLAWVAFRLAQRPADWKRTYGFDRLQVLIALVNGLALFVIAGWIVWEAIERLLAPGPVLGGLMMGVAVAGLVVNLVAFAVLHGADQTNLNVRGAALHVMGDLLGSVAAIVAAGVIILTGWTPIDPLLSVVVALIILVSAWRVVRESGHILLEGAPTGIDTRRIAPSLMEQLPDVRDVHHVHVWSITQERQMVTLHACISESQDAVSVVRRIKQHLNDQFGLEHATVEIEYGRCADTMHAHAHADG
ncbi:MAG: cation diffusion facilitator family transporter [Alphaproteobacteria bacterium]|nr:cation diffusion facilitator family transporter [Alphaproteobacteria bacterium]